MRLNHLVTTEQMDVAQEESKHRTDIDYDICLSSLIDKWYDTSNPRKKDQTAYRINSTLQQMHKEGYSQDCLKFYTILWKYVKEGDE